MKDMREEKELRKRLKKQLSIKIQQCESNLKDNKEDRIKV